MSCLIVTIGSNGPQKFCIEKVGKETWLPRSHTWYVGNLTAVLLPWLETSSDKLFIQQTTKLPFWENLIFLVIFLRSHQLEFSCSCQENKLVLVWIIAAIYKAQ